MSRLTIKKAAKLVLILLTTSSTVFAQSDSAQIRKEIMAVLKKHGYNSFQLNVNSYNQKGGQTAFSITNNYNYTDPKYVPDSANLTIGYYDQKKDKIYVQPKYGTWNSIFVICPDEFFGTMDSSKLIKTCSPSMMEATNIGSGEIVYKNRKYKCRVKSVEMANCMKGNPFCIPIENAKCFFVFGDCINCADAEKWFVYDFGEVMWFRNDKNFSPIH